MGARVRAGLGSTVLASLLLAATPAGAALLATTWATTLPGAGEDAAVAVALAPQAGLVLAAVQDGAPDGGDGAVEVVALQGPRGGEAWRARWPGERAEVAVKGMAATPDAARIVVIGAEGPPGDRDAFVLGFAPGKALWTAREAGIAGGDDEAVAVALAPDGGTAFVALTRAGDAGPQVAAAAYDAATGQRRWQASFPGAPSDGVAEDAAYGLALDPAGQRVFVAGRSWGQGAQDMLVLALDAATGAQLWAHRADGPAHGHDAAMALVVAPDGQRVYGAGAMFHGTAGYDTVGFALDAATGERRWLTRHLEVSGSEFPAAVALSPDGRRLYAAGEWWLGWRDMLTIAWDAASGRQLWSARYDGPGGAMDAAFALAAGEAEVFVAGPSASAHGDLDFTVLSYGALDGALAGEVRHDAAVQHDWAHDLAYDPDTGQLVAGGRTHTNKGGGDATILGLLTPRPPSREIAAS